MSTTTFSSASRTEVRSEAHPVVRQRRLAAGIATVAAVAAALLMTAYFGVFGLLVMAFSTALPILLLWRSSDVLRSDEVRS